MGVAALGSSWLAVLGHHPHTPPQKGILLAGPHRVMSLGGMCGNQHLWMRRRSNTTQPHRGGSCIARKREGQSAEKQLHGRVEETKKPDHP